MFFMRHYLFGILAVFGLSLSFIFDYMVYRQNSLADESGRWVNQSHMVLAHLNQLKDQLRDHPETVDHHFTELRSLISAEPEQLALLDTISAENNSASHIWRTIQQIENSQEELLFARIKRDTVESQKIDQKIFIGNILDFLLLAGLIFYLIYVVARNQKTTKSLSLAIARLTKSNDFLSTHITNQSNMLKSTVHDLKNPLGSIRGFAELIRDEAHSAPSILEMSEVVQRVADHTLVLVNSVLAKDTGRPQEPPQMQKTDVVEMLRHSCRAMEALADAKQQTIKLNVQEKALSIITDPNRLEDILFNIIGNALKFSLPHTQVVVEAEKNAGKAHIRIRDEGPGFSPSDLEKVFQAGQTLSAKPTGAEVSTGYGLYSTKLNVESLKGQIRVSNNSPGPGACFEIDL